MASPKLKKSGTILSKRSPSMRTLALSNPNERVEILHFSHQQHPLVQVRAPYLFTCSGCKEYGAGMTFKCQTCDYYLHDFCALAPPSIAGHPLHTQHQLIFHPKSSGLIRSRCNVCYKTMKGYAFRCVTCNIDIHPTCTMLYPGMVFPTDQHTLFLSPPASATPNLQPTFACSECRRKRSGRVYHCAICNYHIHAVCAKDMVNGLYVHGISATEKPRVLEKAAKAASHVVMGFIGGLVEGIGEAVGEYIIDNMNTRGRDIKNEAK